MLPVIGPHSPRFPLLPYVLVQLWVYAGIVQLIKVGISQLVILQITVSDSQKRRSLHEHLLCQHIGHDDLASGFDTRTVSVHRGEECLRFSGAKAGNELERGCAPDDVDS